MTTRSTLTVREKKNSKEAYSVYRHHDGYPDSEHGVFATLSEALRFAWPLPRYEAMDFAAAVVAAWKDRGGGIYLTKSRDAHGDTEFHYEIYPVDGGLAVDCYKAGRENDGDYTSKRTWTLAHRHTLTANMQIAA